MVKEINTVVYAGRVKDEALLMRSSSGGAFTVLSDFFLDNGDVVVASVYDYESHTTRFCLIRTKEERDAALGSKYMQSEPGNVFRTAYEWLKENPEKKLLFVGMGCQTDGFRKYAEMKQIVDRVCVVDIVCHGTPSPKIWTEYARRLEQRKGTITYLTFKDKRNGWRTPTAYVKIDGREVPIDDYVKVFYSRCTLRPSCHECPYATTERRTDMTIGDFWHIEDTIPDFYDPRGTSLFLIHTNRGQALFDCIRNRLDCRLSDTKQCWQKNLEAPTPVSEFRQAFWEDYQSEGTDFIMKKYGSIPLKTKVKRTIRNIIRGGGTTK